MLCYNQYKNHGRGGVCQLSSALLSLAQGPARYLRRHDEAYIAHINAHTVDSAAALCIAKDVAVSSVLPDAAAAMLCKSRVKSRRQATRQVIRAGTWGRLAENGI